MQRTRYISRVIGQLTGRVARAGYGLARRLSGLPTPQQTRAALLARCLARPGATLIDVGANVGQFASSALAAAPHARILSIDPIPENVQECRRRFASVAGYQAFQAALGERSAESVTFNLHTYSQASSLLPLSETARDSFRSLGAPTRQITVPMYSLDDLLDKVGGFERIDLLKIDVEGGEAQVLRGATRTLQRTRAVLVECQALRMNEGAELFGSVCHIVHSSGLTLTGLFDEIRNSLGDLLLMDLLFERPGD